MARPQRCFPRTAVAGECPLRLVASLLCVTSAVGVVSPCSHIKPWGCEAPDGRLTLDGQPTPGGTATTGPVAVRSKRCQMFMKIKFYNFSPGQGKRLRLGGWRSFAKLLHLSSRFLQSALKQPPLSVPQRSAWLAVIPPAVRVGGSRVFVTPYYLA